MPNLVNAKKALRKSQKRAKKNLSRRADLKTLMKKTRKAIDAKEKDVQEKIRLAQKSLDKAVQKKIIKKNAAIRKLQRLAAAYKKALNKEENQKA